MALHIFIFIVGHILCFHQYLMSKPDFNMKVILKVTKKDCDMTNAPLLG